MTSVEEQILLERVRQLEEAVLTLSGDLHKISVGIREMQDIIVKVATNQQQMANRIADWPYIKVDVSKKKKSPPDLDL